MLRLFVVILFLTWQATPVPAYADEISQPVEPVSVEEGAELPLSATVAHQSPQRAKTGTGVAAGSAAGQTRRGGNGFLNTTLLVGIVVVGATAAIALEAASDNDTIPSTTSTTGAN